MRSVSCRRFAGTCAASRGRQSAASCRAIDRLAEHPRPPGSKKLTSLDLYRIRVGVYRIVYEIHDRELIIAVVKVGHRRDVYDR